MEIDIKGERKVVEEKWNKIHNERKINVKEQLKGVENQDKVGVRIKVEVKDEV